MAADPVHREAERLYNQNKNQETISYCTRVLAAGQLTQAALEAALIFRGAASRNLEDNAAAIRDFTALLELKPSNTFTLFALEYRSVAFRLSGKYGEALEDLNVVLSLTPKSELALEQRGITYRKLGLLPKALKDLDEVLAINPNRALALLARGLARQQQGNYAGAEEDLTKSLELYLSIPTTHPTSFIQLFEQRAYVRRCLNRDRDALQDCLSALQRNKSLVFAKELQQDLTENLDTGIPKKFIYNSDAPVAQYYFAPQYQFWKPTPEYPAPSAPPEAEVRHLFVR